MAMAASESSDKSPKFDVGTRVKINGLKSRADLNGTLGWVVSHDLKEAASLGMERVKVNETRTLCWA